MRGVHRETGWDALDTWTWPCFAAKLCRRERKHDDASASLDGPRLRRRRGPSRRRSRSRSHKPQAASGGEEKEQEQEQGAGEASIAQILRCLLDTMNELYPEAMAGGGKEGGEQEQGKGADEQAEG